MEPVAPWDVVQNLAESISLRVFMWAVITIALVLGIWQYGIRKQRPKVERWEAVLLWYLAVVGWAFFLAVEGRSLMRWPDGRSLIALGFTSVVVSVVVLLLIRSGETWERILSGVVVGLISFGMAACFALEGLEPIGWGILMGTLFGFFFGQASVGTFVLLGWVKVKKDTPPARAAESGNNAEDSGEYEL